MKEALESLYGDFLERQLPDLTERDCDLEPLKGKALALIGMRRVGKTYLCYRRYGRTRSISFTKKNDTTVLIQVSWSLKNEATRQRELRALEEASTEFSKTQNIIVTLDEEWISDDKKIQVLPLWKFLIKGIQPM